MAKVTVFFIHLKGGLSGDKNRYSGRSMYRTTWTGVNKVLAVKKKLIVENTVLFIFIGALGIFSDGLNKGKKKQEFFEKNHDKNNIKFQEYG